MAKELNYSIGKWYFTVRIGASRVVIHRSDRKEAWQRYLGYQQQGKNVEWVGCWNGKSFDDKK